MQYISSWTLPTGEAYRNVVAEFLKDGGAPPAGVKLLGRWHGANGKGFLVMESDDPKAIFGFFAHYQEFMEIESTPALEDADAGAVLQSLYG